MTLSNLNEWNSQGTACGSADKPAACGSSDKPSACGAACGNCHFTILPTGDVYACRRLPSKVGNAFKDRLSDLWLNQMEDYRQYDKFEKCSKCELLRFCRGCPAVAYGTNGSFYSEDPQCWKKVN